MLPSDYELRVVEQRDFELRREASAHRLAQESRTVAAPGGGIVARLRGLIGDPARRAPVATAA
jgi:hypothetical protein